jgi:hypothetical protein
MRLSERLAKAGSNMLLTAIPPLMGYFLARNAGLLWVCKRALPNHSFEQLRHQPGLSRSTAMRNELAKPGQRPG